MTHNGNNPYARSEIANLDPPRERGSWWPTIGLGLLLALFGVTVVLGYYLVWMPLRGIWE